MYDHPNNSDTSCLYLDGSPEPLRRMPTTDVEPPELPQRDVSPRLRRKTAIRGSLRMSDDSVGQQNPMQHSMGQPQPLFELSGISLGRQITSRSSGSVSSTPRIGAELTRVSCDPMAQAGRFIHERRRRSVGIFHQLKRCFRPPCQDSSSSTEESAPARFRVISNERCRPQSIGWPSRLDLANRPTKCAHESVLPPMLDAIPNFSSDIADWLSELPDLTSDDVLGGQSENMLKIATPASLSGMRSRQKEQVEIVQNEEENTTDFFCY